MKATLIAAFIGIACVATLHAGSRSSANYSIESDGVDGGGARASSAAYANDSSTGGFAGTTPVSATATTTSSGFVAQISEVVGLAITGASGAVSAGTPLQLSAWLSLDDGSLLPVPNASAFQWSFNGAAITGATGTTHTLPSTQAFQSGSYTVATSDGAMTSGTGTVVTVAAPPTSSSRLLNLSTRAQCLTGDNVLIPGFVVSGSTSKRLLIRTVGAQLAAFGVTGVLPNPQMVLKRLVSGAYQDFASNDNWETNTNVTAIVSTSADLQAFALDAGSLDSVLLLDVPPGQYTVVASGVGDTTGVGLVELYDADATTGGARLANISNRGFVGTGGNIMIPGFVVSSEGSKRVLIRAVGPTLGSFGVAGTLSDPTLTIYSGSTALFTNDDWSSNATIAATTTAVGAQVFAFPLADGSKDAALVLTLAPGSYTVQASGVGGATGVALLEIYDAP